ncbi:transglycosylase SLT domain-containing protein [Falsiroseomonas sp. E2-1-a20]|uniref:transglycosylase SLT domain-containing protein n=1 Tax=Falsiroseomonas sp. E2-1-a20 TaxID=3239300 RepID=UPI003F35D21D
MLPVSLAGGLLALSLPAPVAQVVQAQAAATIYASAPAPAPPAVAVAAAPEPVPYPPPPAPDIGPSVELPAPPAEIVRALFQASRATGADPALLLALAWRESSFDRKAANRQSTALGLMQFTEATWLETVRDFGPRHGLAAQARAIVTDRRTGRISVRDERSRRYLLALRTDARLSAVLAAARLVAEAPALEAALGRPLTPVDLYAVHFLGRTGARRFLAEMDRAPGQAVVRVVSADGLARNRNVFVGPDGSSRRLGDVHATFAAAIQDQRALHGRLFAGAGGTSAG